MASAEYSVLTPERVSLQYDIAGVGSRGTAALIDSFIQGVVLTLIVVALAATAVIGSALKLANSEGAVIFLFALAVLASFLITAGYYILFEIIWSGQTPGKRLLGVRVMRDNGYPLRPVDAVVRNLVRIVDWLPGYYAIGVVSMLLNKRSKRLGDFAAGTIVVREGLQSRGVAPSQTSATAASSVGGAAYALSPADASLVRDFLVRRATMDPERRTDLAARLASVLSTRYGLPPNSAPNAEAFLEALDA
jgi:uncharacterized RDD family membrane protein YckC